MGKETIKYKIKDIIYKLVKPIWLWSIGFKDFDDYVEALIDSECCRGTIKRIK